MRRGGALLLAGVIFVGGCNHLRGGRNEDVSSRLEIVVADPADTDADVWVDGQYIGQVGEVSGRLELAPGKHRVEVRKPGHFPVQRTVEVARKPAATLKVEAELLSDPR